VSRSTACKRKAEVTVSEQTAAQASHPDVPSNPHSSRFVSFSLLCDVTLGRHAAFAGLDAVLANHHESAHGVRHLAIVELRPLGIQSMPDLMRASWMRATETLCRLRDEYSQNPKLYQLCCACAGLLTSRSCSSGLTAPRTRYCGCQPRAVLVSCRRYFRNADCSRRARYGQRLCVISSRGPCSGHKGSRDAQAKASSSEGYALNRAEK